MTLGIVTTIILSYYAISVVEITESGEEEGEISAGGIEKFRFAEPKLENNILRYLSLAISFTVIIMEIMSTFVIKEKIENKLDDLPKKFGFEPRMIMYKPNRCFSMIKIVLLIVNSVPGGDEEFQGQMLGGEYLYTFDIVILIIVLFRLLF